MTEKAEQATKRWYVVHTYSGFEKKVKESLEQRISAMGYEDRIEEILIPTEDVVERRGNKRVVTDKKLFPGYLLIKMEMDDHLWHFVRSTPKASRAGTATGLTGTSRG